MVAHEIRILRFAQRMLLNRDAARDAPQETFLRLYRNIASFSGGRDALPWLYRTVSNICFDLLRRRKYEWPLDILAGPAEYASSETPERAATASQAQRLLLEALQTLTPRERQAIVLRDVEGYETGEVSRLLGASETTVRSHISRGRVRLRQYFEQRGGK